MRNWKAFSSLLFLFLVSIFFVGCKILQNKTLPVTSKEIESHIRFLSDDLLEGRGVGSRGLAIASLYQENFFRGLGLEPIFGQSFRQPFDLKGSKPDSEANLEVFSARQLLAFKIFDDFVLNSFREDCPEGIEGELVYGGYLIQAPERNWDDIKGADLRGKVLLVEINEPGNYPDGIFEGEEMTYYGRWTYKLEKAAELKAAGILIVHQPKGAGYGWEVVENTWSRERFFLSDQKQELFFQGWIRGDAALEILTSRGYSHEELLAQAERQDFTPFPLGLTVRVRQKPKFRTVSAENIAGMVPGKKKKSRDRYIILSAHYDHLGKEERPGPDQIYNGAVDNCSASAVLLSLARYYSQKPYNLEANLVFFAATAEEEGLLGSEYFVRQMPFQDKQVLANINFEMTNVWGETEDVYAIGAKHSDLDEIARRAAENLGLQYIPERGGNLGFFFRSDQLSFARGGIPAVWLHQGIRSKGKNKEFALKKLEEYQKTRYHQLGDEIEEDWDLRGTCQIARWAEEIVSLLSKTPSPPEFRESSSFRRKSR